MPLRGMRCASVAVGYRGKPGGMSGAGGKRNAEGKDGREGLHRVIGRRCGRGVGGWCRRCARVKQLCYGVDADDGKKE
jgi:hypothetical protein